MARILSLFLLLVGLGLGWVVPVHAQATVRYYISDILPPTPGDDFGAYRLAVHDAVPQVSYAAVIPTDPATGLPLFQWGIAYVGGEDFSGVDADLHNFQMFPGVVAADLGSLLTALSVLRTESLPLVQRQALRQKLVSLGLSKDIQGLALRRVLQEAGRFLQPNFDETNLYVIP